jgi:hypothetical protein
LSYLSRNVCEKEEALAGIGKILATVAISHYNDAKSKTVWFSNQMQLDISNNE